MRYVLTSLSAKMLKYTKDVYANDVDFSNIFISCDEAITNTFYKHSGTSLRKISYVYFIFHD